MDPPNSIILSNETKKELKVAVVVSIRECPLMMSDFRGGWGV
jgi:hypothetical protein